MINRRSNHWPERKKMTQAVPPIASPFSSFSLLAFQNSELLFQEDKCVFDSSDSVYEQASRIILDKSKIENGSKKFGEGCIRKKEMIKKVS